ncbi:ephrin type-B receptor 6 isoform X1 [Dromiciops gliroides]|uniref:ephrin type-B receptor 6 isoform X1 n=1 Tax=Dromiciops gliroides TaxID=33562 RepID=UPI001CC4798D|nr:ephrin type-B receptor 6 isoform X1 [Dromiciops gliroides]XP_043824288.1 ephrin type-B receptor 6 isoform X1 [Dromiciops gliroides]XP_043824289.1 ephrin type-B receptor 6 isoform X1 [Dromiciops gliroides]XP_043824290.1 ephrin type-B receptor 6 isoform X1 [Dromiciops gliroides]
MSIKGATQPGDKVGDMVWMWVLFLITPALALEEVLLDTTGETSEIGWLTYPPGGWDEVSVLDNQQRLTRTFEACHVAEGLGLGQDNWLQTHFVDRQGAHRAHIRLHFSVRACTSLGVGGGTCRETFTLYYRQAEEPDDPSRASSWHLGPWIKVDTIAADESFPASASSSSWAGGAGLQLNVKERSFGPLTQRGFYVAFQDTGACLALVVVKIFAYSCPAVLQAFASFPETQASGAGGASLVEAVGTCVAQAEPEDDGVGSNLPRLHCNGEGEWMVSVGTCHCRPGYQPAHGDKACQACPMGSFKSMTGAASCMPCPSRSHTAMPGAPVCPCLSGFYRSSSDSPEAPCTGPPSAPRDLWFEVQGSSLMLYWRLPQDLGGRGDVRFNILCRQCGGPHGPESGACHHCGDEVYFDPRQQGLTESRVLIGGLQAHVPYILEVQSLNGVSELSFDPPKTTSINVSIIHEVPPAVPLLHQVSRASDSITVSWPQPDQRHGRILDYQLRYYDQAEDEAHFSILTSESNTATISQLSPGHVYGFQVRARSAAGHGPYGGKVYFQTLPQGELSHMIPERLPLVVGSALGALAFLLLAAITIFAFVFQRKRQRTGYTEPLQQYASPSGLGVKYYTDPSTYEDPSQAVREFTREVDPAYVKIEEVIGPGSFGEVCRGWLQPRGRREQAVAIHTLWASGVESQRGAFLGRAAVLGQFHHPNVLRLEGVVTKSQPLMVLTELMENGPLDSFLRQQEGQFSNLQLVAMQRGVAAAMQYLSSCGFVHRALTAQSVLVNGHLVCKVARLSHGHSDLSPSSQGSQPPLRWAAPEVLTQGKFTTASDVWSFGILMWEVMSYGERPYWDMSDQEVLNAIEQEFRLPPPPGCPNGLHLLMLDTWQQDSAQRPHFDQLVAALDKMIRKPEMLQAGGVHRGRPSQTLLSPVTLDFSSLETPQAWLAAIGMECYQDSFSNVGLCSFNEVAQLGLEDMPALGITLAGHQKKLLHNIHLLQQHLSQPDPVEV